MDSSAPSSDTEAEITSDMHPNTISEEVQDLMMSSDGEASESFRPPPHIAARIYKNPSSRRKTSAASSRRNSMTSHHSSRSARSGQGRPLSTHIAQHLRRASIIESRKAKAADRNAHAELVRLRAAQNKAAPRITANSEEKAMAVQQARERYLAQVKASCAEEVKRSKRVAEEQREKRAAETLRLREDMEERHAEAEKRKILLQQSQRRPRVSTIPSIEDTEGSLKKPSYVWKPNSPKRAAEIIQRVWRHRMWQRNTREFLQLGLTVEAIQKTSFEDVGELFSQERLLTTTIKLLRLFKLHNPDDDSAQENAAARTFLSSFLVLGHPAYVLSKEGEQEQDLTNRATELLLQFNRVINVQEPPATVNTLAELSESYAAYHAAFTAWREHDSSYMVSSMVAQFVELDAIWQTVKDDRDGAVANDYREGIQHNQTLLLARLKKLTSPERAMRLIKDAVKASRKSKATKKREAKTDTKPRVASSSSMAETRSSTAVIEPALDKIISVPDSSNSSTRARSQLERSSLVPDNRVVIHEIAIYKEWKIDVEPKLSMRDNLIASVSSDLQRALDAGLDDIWIPAMAETLQEKLLNLLTPGNSLYRLIKEALDPSLVAAQVKHATFSYVKFFAFMDTILPQLCAPVRDLDVKDLATNPSEDPIKQLARLYYVIDIIQLDMLNFTMTRLAPTLLKESSGYESRRFTKELNGRFPEKTLMWWKDSAIKAQEELTRRSSGTAVVATGRATAPRIYMYGLTDLAIRADPITDDAFPETLALDRERFSRIHADILRMITISSILVTAKSLLRRDVRSLWKAEAQRMWDLPFSSASAAFVSIVESRYALPPTTQQQLSGTITRLISDAREEQVTHPLMKVMLKKMKAHVLTRMCAASAEERIKATATAGEVLGMGGLPEFVTRISDIVNELSRVAEVDRDCHGEWYEKIVKMTSKDESSDIRAS